jgi:exopolyphosphatase/guanosine-5'-triphosphate,3'-diphosphate pyrophosphatase
VHALADRYHIDKEHVLRVKRTISYILDQLGDDFCGPNREYVVQFLNWAADLHEIGQDIAHSQYHKHSAYIIENGDFSGFSKQDQVLLSTIVKSHRRKISRSLFKELPSPWNVDALVVTIILRLSVLLHRNRQEHDKPDFKISLTKSKVRLQFPDHWLAQAPLTHADLIQEATYLKSAGFKLEFS